MRQKTALHFLGEILLSLLITLLLTSHIVVTYGQSSQTSQGNEVIYLPLVSKPIPEQDTPDATACKLPEVDEHRQVRVGFPRHPQRMATTGTVRAKVLFTDFPDSPATQTMQQAFSMISPGAARHFKAVSYGRMDYQLEPHFAWLRMSKPSTEYTFATFHGHREYIQEAVNLADSAVDFSGVDQIVVITNPDTQSFSNGPTLTGNINSGGINADGHIIYNAVTSGYDLNFWGFLWLNHESGHSMGLVDTYGYGSESTHEFVGGFSLMGLISGRAPEFLAYERWQLGWLDDTQIYCQQTNDETVYLTAVEKEGGIKAIIVPTGPTSAVVVESRRAVGYDSQLPNNGVLVYTVDSSISSGYGPIQVFPKDDPPYYYNAPLALNETVTVGHVTIRVVQATADVDGVQVSVVK